MELPDFEFLHAADLHLDSPLRGLDASAPAARIRGATREALVNLVDLALARAVAFVLLAGDLYDGDGRDWRTGHFLVEQLARLKRAGIPVIAIRGNHDAESVLTRDLKLPAEQFASNKPGTILLEQLEVAIHGQSFASRAVTENLARFYPAPRPGWFNIGLLHTACGSTEHSNYAPCTEAELAAARYDYWALGHVHTRQEFVHPHCRIVFPGNLQGRHIREPGAKGASLVRVVSGRIAAVEHHPLDVMRWELLRVDASGAPDLDAILGRARILLDAALIGAEGRLLAVRVVLEGACPAHRQLERDPDGVREQLRALATDIADRDALWIEDVRIRTCQAIDEAALAGQPGAVGALVGALVGGPGGAPPLEPGTREFVQLMARHLDLLEEDHPARIIEREGVVPAGLAERARALLLAELVLAEQVR